MHLKDVPKSKNILDHTQKYWSPEGLGYNLLKTLFNSTDVEHGAPDGYENWLKETLHNFTSEDLYIMQSHGLDIEQMQRLKNHIGSIKSGKFDGDVSAIPYNDKFGDEVVKRERALNRER